MGVRGAARREQKPRQKLSKPVMKPFSPAPQPASASTPPTSPTPTPSVVPEPELRPRLRDDLPPAVHAAELHSNLHTEAQPMSRNLLISPVKANSRSTSRELLRQNSSRNPNTQKRQQGQECDDTEEIFTAEFRVYPFPPSTRPLCYPINEPPHPSNSHAESDSLPSSRKKALRKMLLERWRDDLAAKERAEIGSTRDTPSDASQRRLADSPRATRKRGRSPPLDDESVEGAPVIRTMSGVAHSMASAPFDLDEGDPVLPMIGASRTVEIRSNGTNARAARGDSTEFGRAARDAKHAKYSRNGAKQTSTKNPSRTQPQTTDHGTIPSSRKMSAVEMGTMKTQGNESAEQLLGNTKPAASDGLSDDVHSAPTPLQKLKNTIYVLKDRRRLLEQKELDEITKEAAQSSSVTVTNEDRMRLKEEIEGLSKHAVRDLLRLISRRMQGLESSPHAEVKEVKLPLDILPADLTKELRLMVLREKGQLALPVSEELRKVREELRAAVQEYRRQRNLART